VSGFDPALLDPPWALHERPGSEPKARTNMVHRMLETPPVVLEPHIHPNEEKRT
jgi:hypothetical protein